METIGQRLRRLRYEQGLSVGDLAGSVGVSPSAIRQLESGQVKNPSFALGLRLANSLHVDPSHLALGEGRSVTDHLERLDARVAALEKHLAQQHARR